jgi:hypothetical protein
MYRQVTKGFCLTPDTVAFCFDKEDRETVFPLLARYMTGPLPRKHCLVGIENIGKVWQQICEAVWQVRNQGRVYEHTKQKVPCLCHSDDAWRVWTVIISSSRTKMLIADWTCGFFQQLSRERDGSRPQDSLPPPPTFGFVATNHKAIFRDKKLELRFASTSGLLALAASVLEVPLVLVKEPSAHPAKRQLL